MSRIAVCLEQLLFPSHCCWAADTATLPHNESSVRDSRSAGSLVQADVPLGGHRFEFPASVCSTADERPSVKSIFEPQSLFPVCFSLLGVLFVSCTAHLVGHRSGKFKSVSPQGHVCVQGDTYLVGLTLFRVSTVCLIPLGQPAIWQDWQNSSSKWESKSTTKPSLNTCSTIYETD